MSRAIFEKKYNSFIYKLYYNFFHIFERKVASRVTLWGGRSLPPPFVPPQFPKMSLFYSIKNRHLLAANVMNDTHVYSHACDV